MMFFNRLIENGTKTKGMTVLLLLTYCLWKFLTKNKTVSPLLQAPTTELTMAKETISDGRISFSLGPKRVF